MDWQLFQWRHHAASKIHYRPISYWAKVVKRCFLSSAEIPHAVIHAEDRECRVDILR